MHPEFLKKYGDQLKYFIRVLVAYYKVEPAILLEMGLSEEDINKEGLVSLCSKVDMSYTALLNYAQQPDLFPISANAQMNKFAVFSNHRESMPFHQVASIHLQPDGKALQMACCGLACWNSQGTVLTTAFYDVFKRGEQGFNLACYDYRTGKWLVSDQLFYGNFLELNDLGDCIEFSHGGTFSQLPVENIDQAVTIF